MFVTMAVTVGNRVVTVWMFVTVRVRMGMFVSMRFLCSQPLPFSEEKSEQNCQSESD